MIANNRVPHGHATQQYRRSEAGTYHAHYDPDSSAGIEVTLVHALADVMNVDVTEVEFTLSDVIDPDALDRIFDPISDTDAPPAHLAFDANGYRVTVYSTGEIVITPPPGHAE